MSEAPQPRDQPRERVTDTQVSAYALDAEDRITAVNAAWQAFAVQNAGPAAHAVIGTSLWQHVADATTRYLYGLLFERVRVSMRPTRVAFRCDSPHVVREMTLEIVPRPARALVLRGRLVAQAERPPIGLLAGSTRRAGAFVRMCGWCKRVHVDGAWHELERALAASALLAAVPAPAVTHGICEPCEQTLYVALDRADWSR